ncbi:MAG: YebC/PmpR family DNA-binding transcriptional regulator [Hymenobacteraceae bacterium]|nr:YebC/PmpR family DNA-binding transcriptional regulator [Hymenobacteraceae bacterium]MDX5396373.1 YebC/PmpR family DNA-binding transcriptional regulator [Hymenobacteraceae bacterium]MDX5444159.1 YebC/PmpR family DNA-binding transcriptional regulator [Hymenobacteraceae bacterium]MDX5512435.1 YebC/PmpR family DNA-binding transcriptional regulator [Hymenobacteraceae bacterium]
MGRAFEFRKARKFKRWDKMSKAFTRIGKEIVMAVKEGGPDPTTNARLRAVINNAKGVNMPKDRIEAAIKRASNKDEKDYEEVVYEGYGPYGIAIVVETATDNPVRTVANVRMHLTRSGGSLGKTGSLDFLFERKGIFRIPAEGKDIEELELELIDHGAQDIYEHEGEIIVETAFTDFGAMQKALEEMNIEATSSELQRIPLNRTELTDEQAEEIETLVEKLEEDDDVQAVFHNMG